MPKPVYEEGDVIVLWNQAIHTDRKVTVNRADIIIKNKNRENMHADRRGNTRRQKCRAKVSGTEVRMKEFRYRDTTNVEPEIYNYTSYNWSHWESNEKLKEKSGSYTSKTLDRFTTEDSYTWNITHNTESTAV
jgi:hypothetical protein